MLQPTLLLADVADALAAAASQPPAECLGAGDTYADQVTALSRIVAAATRALAHRIAGHDRTASNPPVGIDLAREAGVPLSQARALRRLGTFAHQHPALEAAWLEGAVSSEQVAAVAEGCR